ncbi:MAG: hypothetical protein ACE5GA_04440, partial [Candidatus Zixiibacteriota bacterium]
SYQLNLGVSIPLSPKFSLVRMDLALWLPPEAPTTASHDAFKSLDTFPAQGYYGSEDTRYRQPIPGRLGTA